MQQDGSPDAEQNSGRGTSGPEPPATEGYIPLDPRYNADLTKEEMVLLATLGIRNPATGEIVSIKAVAGVLGRMLQKIQAQTIEASHENKDSLELSRNAQGKYAYKIKVYMDAWRKPEMGIMLVDNINKEMLARYVQEPVVSKI